MSLFYGTSDGFLEYCAERGRDVPPDGMVPETVGEALINASERLDSDYRHIVGGLKTAGREQVREWPREGTVDAYGYAISPRAIPREVTWATYELALRWLRDRSALGADYTPPEFKSVSVSGAVSVNYNAFADAKQAQTQFPIVRQIMSGLIGSNGNSSLVGSAVRT